MANLRSLSSSRPLQARSFGLAAVLSVGALVMGACGDDGSSAADTTAAPAQADAPPVVATTSIWADVTANVACNEVEVTTLIPVGTDSHTFEPSVQDADQLREAALIVANGLGLEEGVLDAIDAAEADGVAVVELAENLNPIEAGAGSHSHSEEEKAHSEGDGHAHAEEEKAHSEGDGHSHSEGDGHSHSEGDGHSHSEGDGHSHAEEMPAAAPAPAPTDPAAPADPAAAPAEEEKKEDGHSHSHDGGDPHVWMDPDRVAMAVPLIAEALTSLEGFPLDAEQVATCADEYVAELEALSTELDEQFAGLSPEQRRLVTSHEALGYLADRFDFEVIGAIIPSTSTLGESNVRDLEELATTMQEKGVTRIFGEVTGSDDVAAALAEQVGSEVEVVALYTESLGDEGSDAATYIDMMRTNGSLIVG